ncbi:MAG: hypothetical protein ABSG57_11205 [Candidatus Bathyarchaeia archaeon]
MTILQKGRLLKIPVVFTRENTDTHNRKTVVYLERELVIKCWEEDDYLGYELTLLRGHSGRLLKIEEGKPLVPEPMLRVFLSIPNEAGNCTSEIDGFLTAKYDGLTIKVTGEEKVITAKEAAERINSGTVLFLNEDFTKRTIDC